MSPDPLNTDPTPYLAKQKRPTPKHNGLLSRLSATAAQKHAETEALGDKAKHGPPRLSPSSNEMWGSIPGGDEQGKSGFGQTLKAKHSKSWRLVPQLNK